MNDGRRYTVFLRDGREIEYADQYSYMDGGVSFLEADGSLRTYSSGALLYVRTVCDSDPNIQQEYYDTNFDLINGTKVILMSASKASYSHGYWWVMSYVEGVEFMIPCSALVQITEKEKEIA